MKKLFTLISLFSLMCCAMPANAQKYKTARDTGKLNLEYVKVSNDIAGLKADLIKAQEKLPEYQNKARSLELDAENAASSNKKQADKATNGSVGEAKEAKKKANKSYDKAKDARKAQKELEKHQQKIEKLSIKIEEKQRRLQELTDMRIKINFLM